MTCDETGAGAHPSGVRGELRVEQRTAAEDLGGRGVLRVVADGHDDGAVGRREQLIRHEVRVRRAHAGGTGARDERVLRDVDEGLGGGMEQRDEQAPFHLEPGAHSRERGHDRDQRVLPGEHVGESHAGPHGFAVGFTGHGHPPRLGLHHIVIARASGIGAEASNRAPEEARVGGEEGRGVEPPLGKRPRQEVVHDDVSVREEAGHHRPVRGLRQVRGDAQLVPVAAEEVGAFAAIIERRPPRPRFVAGGRTFDFQHIGPKIPQSHSREGPG